VEDKIKIKIIMEKWVKMHFKKDEYEISQILTKYCKISSEFFNSNFV
jgi:hypothetical protein